MLQEKAKDPQGLQLIWLWKNMGIIETLSINAEIHTCSGSETHFKALCSSVLAPSINIAVPA